MKDNSINLKEFDSFIQDSLHKYFFVEPWKKLYDRTGNLHKDIISDKSTIPDLIIYNKIFNKSFCFYTSNPNTFIKFPRKRFILRPKYREEYNPTDTYGKDETLFYREDKQQNIEANIINNTDNENELEIKNDNAFMRTKIIPEINQMEAKDLDKKEETDNENQMEEEEEEEPEWANDDVKEFNNEEIEFKAIPKSLEEKINNDIELEMNSTNDRKKENIIINEDKQISINIDNFFANEDNNNFKEIQTINKGSNKNNINKDKNEKNMNDLFDIFDTENKFKNIYLEEDESSNENISNQEEIEDDYKNNFKNANYNNINRFPLNHNQSNIQMRNLINNRRYINNNLNTNITYAYNNQLMNQGNIQNFNPYNSRNMNEKYIYNIYNNNNFNFVNLNNLGYHPLNNTNLINYNNISNLSNYNNAYLQANNMPSLNINNSGMNERELYVNNLNNMIHRQNIQNAIKYNLINNNFNNNPYILYNNINLMNSNIPIGSFYLNNNITNNIPTYKNNTTNNNDKNKFDISKTHHDIKEDEKEMKNNRESSNKNLDPIDYYDSPTQILLKNISEKKWIVYEKDKGNFIRNFNTPELYEYLKEKEGDNSFNNLSINDSDTDYFFPTNEIYENLKKLYRSNLI